MDRDEVLRLVDAGDTRGLLLLTVRAWASSAPACDEVAVFGRRGDRLVRFVLVTDSDLVVIPIEDDPSTRPSASPEDR